jgi:uncharacterized membrane protein YeaQ/YmgE (transglycosylase-associated protein family)
MTFLCRMLTEYAVDSVHPYLKERYRCAREESQMNIVTLLVVAVLVGWLATLILHSDVDSLSLLDLGVGVAGAALVGGLAPFFGISTTGEYGLTLAGTFVSWLGAMSLLALVNLVRHGRFLCDGRRPHGNR